MKRRKAVAKSPRHSLPTRWIRWRRYRYQLLVAEGLACHLAWPVAAAEAKYRHCVGRIIGNDAAHAAELVEHGEGFALRGGANDLSCDQIDAILKLSSRVTSRAA